MTIKVGDRVAAPIGYSNDFAGGEGIVHEVTGKDFRIMVTKKARGYKVGDITTSAEWDHDGIHGGVKLLVYPAEEEMISDHQKLGKWKL